MLATANWGAIIVVAQKVADDIRLNRAPPAPGASQSPDALIAELEAILPTWQAAWKAHQGVATGAADLLQHLADNGVPYAGTIRQAILSTPGAIAEAEKWLPTVAWALNAFAPAATGVSGDAPAFGPRIGRG